MCDNIVRKHRHYNIYSVILIQFCCDNTCFYDNRTAVILDIYDDTWRKKIRKRHNK